MLCDPVMGQDMQRCGRAGTARRRPVKWFCFNPTDCSCALQAGWLSIKHDAGIFDK